MTAMLDDITPQQYEADHQRRIRELEARVAMDEAYDNLHRTLRHVGIPVDELRRTLHIMRAKVGSCVKRPVICIETGDIWPNLEELISLMEQRHQVARSAVREHLLKSMREQQAYAGRHYVYLDQIDTFEPEIESGEISTSSGIDLARLHLVVWKTMGIRPNSKSRHGPSVDTKTVFVALALALPTTPSLGRIARHLGTDHTVVMLHKRRHPERMEASIYYQDRFRLVEAEAAPLMKGGIV